MSPAATSLGGAKGLWSGPVVWPGSPVITVNISAPASKAFAPSRSTEIALGEWATPMLRDAIYERGTGIRTSDSLEEMVQPADRVMESAAGLAS
jgi:hypothetical protein